MELILPIIVVLGVLWLGDADSRPRSEDVTSPEAGTTVNDVTDEASGCELGPHRYRVLVSPSDELR